MARAKFTPPDPVFDQPPPAGFNIRAGVKGFALLYWGLLVLVIFHSRCMGWPMARRVRRSRK